MRHRFYWHHSQDILAWNRSTFTLLSLLIIEEVGRNFTIRHTEITKLRLSTFYIYEQVVAIYASQAFTWVAFLTSILFIMSASLTEWITYNRLLKLRALPSKVEKLKSQNIGTFLYSFFKSNFNLYISVDNSYIKCNLSWNY